MPAAAPDLTHILKSRTATGALPLDRIVPHVYDVLRTIARHQLAGSRPGDTLDTTSLVHEAYLRLADQSQLSWSDRAHFLAIASRAMRFVIVDQFRYQSADKRGGTASPLPLHPSRVGRAPAQIGELLDLDRALDELAAFDDRAARVVECRFFGGLTVKETAEALGCSSRTVKRDWRKARLLLYRMINGSNGDVDDGSGASSNPAS